MNSEIRNSQKTGAILITLLAILMGPLFNIPVIVIVMLFCYRRLENMDKAHRGLFMLSLSTNLVVVAALTCLGLLVSLLNPAYLQEIPALGASASKAGLLMVIYAALFRIVYQDELMNQPSASPSLLRFARYSFYSILAYLLGMVVLSVVQLNLYMTFLGFSKALGVLLLIPLFGFFMNTNPSDRWAFLKAETYSYICLILLNFSLIFGRLITNIIRS